MKKWQQKEKIDAKDFDGKRIKGSGNQWYAPGDIKTSNLLIDSKQTNKKSFSVSLKIWDKLYEEALFSHRIPLLSLQIQDTEIVVLDKKDFLTILQKKKAKRG